MQDITTQVVGQPEAVPSKDGQSIRHMIPLSGGVGGDGIQYPAEKYVTFDAGLAAKAQSTVGQQVSARVEIKSVPKARGGGFWTNYVLHDIAPSGMLQPMAMPAAGGTPVQQSQTVPQPTAPVNPPQGQTHPALAEQGLRDAANDRRSAFHAALQFAGAALQAGVFPDYPTALQAARTLTDDLAGYAGTGTWENAAQSVQGDANPPSKIDPNTPHAVAAQVPGVSVGVPFDQPQS